MCVTDFSNTIRKLSLRSRNTWSVLVYRTRHAMFYLVIYLFIYFWNGWILCLFLSCIWTPLNKQLILQDWKLNTMDGEAAGIMWNWSWLIVNRLVTRNIGKKILVNCRPHRMHRLQVFGNFYNIIRGEDPNLAWLVVRPTFLRMPYVAWPVVRILRR
jgi:hypothetical protein